jgi:hypothetical protein
VAQPKDSDSTPRRCSMIVEDNAASQSAAAKFIAYTQGYQWNGTHD